MCQSCPGALVKTDEQEVINFLLTTEIIPLCLRIMESGSELSKTVLSLFVTFVICYNLLSTCLTMSQYFLFL